MSKYETEYEGWEWIDGGWARGYEDVVTDLDAWNDLYGPSDAEIQHMAEMADQQDIEEQLQDFSI
jgi:hypothetical protein